MPLLTPRLWTPGQVKPPGIPQIDWSHPITNGLVFYGFDLGNGLIVDLARYRTMLPVAGATAATTSTGAYGTGFLWNNSDGRGFTSDAEVQSGPPWSFAAGYVQTGTVGAYTSIFQRSAENGTGAPFVNWGFVVNNNSEGQSLVRVSHNESGTYQVSTAWSSNSNNVFHSLVGSAPDIATLDFYADGVLNSHQNPLSGSLFSDTTNDPIIFSGQGLGAPTNPFIGFVYYGARWSGRVLSADEVALLHADPYCFLIFGDPDQFAAIAAQAGTFLGANPWPQWAPILAQ